MNKTAFVTGAGTGIGKGIAIKLATAGYDVAVHCNSSRNGAEETKKIITDMGKRCEIFQYDISSVSCIRNMFSDFSKSFDKLDLFVNNAGVTVKSKFLETTDEDFDKLVNVDFKGAYFCMQEAARMMKSSRTKGSIVIISSNNAFAHFADVSVYGSVKAAVGKLAEHAAIELASYNIRVNTIAPGWTDTGAARLDAKDTTYYKIPLKKWATTEEIADAVIYLASESARSVTGVTLVIDNGALLQSDKWEKYN